MQTKPSNSPRPRQGSGKVVAIATISAALAVAVAVGGCGGSSAPAPPKRGPRQSLLSIFWADTQLNAIQSKRCGFSRAWASRWCARRSTGPTSVSSYSYATTKPAQLNPTDPSSYLASGWASYDAIDRAAAATGLQLFVTLTGPIPLWASGPGGPPKKVPETWKPSAPDFGDFVRAVGKRYSGHYTPPGASSPLPRIHFWSIWNEPNYGTNLQPQVDATGQPVSPRLYRSLVDPAGHGLQATGTRRPPTRSSSARPRRTESSPTSPAPPTRWSRSPSSEPSTASTPTSSRCRISRVQGRLSRVLEQFPCRQPGVFDASGWATHPYTGGKTPMVLTTGIPGSADYADFAALPQLANTLDRTAEAYGSIKLPIYSTEFGYQTNPPNPGPTTTSPDNAARYMKQAEYFSWHNPRIWSTTNTS